jgi:hypothetical protein
LGGRPEKPRIMGIPAFSVNGKKIKKKPVGQDPFSTTGKNRYKILK